MEKIKSMLSDYFTIDSADIVKTIGGLSAAAYKVITPNKSFFLKVYDKRLAQTHIWVENIDNYMPILVWLNKNTKLRGKIVHPIINKEGNYRTEDNESVYILFDFIEGETIAQTPLTDTQVIELAEIMAELHGYGQEIPLDTKNMLETFEILFCDSLEKYISNDYAASPNDIKKIMNPCLEQLQLKIETLKMLSHKVKQKNPKLVLCHMDAHGWNMMQSDHLILVDWEGMKLAPAEADLFLFSQKCYWTRFLAHYKRIRPEFIMDDEMLAFYSVRRKLEDIWAFLEDILYNNLSGIEHASAIEYLFNECKDLDRFCF